MEKFICEKCGKIEVSETNLASWYFFDTYETNDIFLLEKFSREQRYETYNLPKKVKMFCSYDCLIKYFRSSIEIFLKRGITK